MFADGEGISLNGVTAAAMGALLIAVSGALTFVFKLLFNLLMASKDQQLVDKDRQLAEWKERAASFQKLAERSVQSQEEKVAQELAARGIDGVPLLAKVPASHNSPVSEAQQFSADFESLKARQVAAELALAVLPPKDVSGDATITTAEPEVIGKVKIVDIAPEALTAIAQAASGAAEAMKADKHE